MSAGREAKGRVMPLAEWPPADRAAWAEALTGADLFDPVPRPALRWRASTREATRGGYGRWLAWLDGAGLLDRSASFASRVTRSRVAAYAADLAATGSGFSVAGRIQQLGDALRAIAPHDDWGWVLRGSGRLRARAVPAKDKHARMQSPYDLVELGLELMRRGDTDVHATALTRAKLHRDGLMIALLARRPMRGGNLGAIALGQHLRRHGAAWSLTFTPEQTKQARHLEPSWPGELVEPLERHLAVHRPRLLAGTRKALPPTDRLWVSAHGTAMSYAAVALQIKARTAAAFGASVNPHLFRDCAATAIATCAPEQARDVALVLGHAGLATSERHYNHARMLGANARHQDGVEATRQREAAAKPKRGQGA